MPYESSLMGNVSRLITTLRRTIRMPDDDRLGGPIKKSGRLVSQQPAPPPMPDDDDLGGKKGGKK